MYKLKAVHFAIAFLMVILAPVFLGASELPPYQKYTGPIKPGVVITKENFNTYLPELKELLPPSKLKWMSMGITEGLVTMPIVKTTCNPPSNGQMEATRKYAGAARVGVGNQLLNWTAGTPFPEPKSAVEIAWNCYHSVNRSGHETDDLKFFRWFGLFQGSKYEKHFCWKYFGRGYRGRTDMPPLGDMPEFKEKDLCFASAMLITEPQEVKGFVQLRLQYWDTNKADEVYAYIPAIRRLRRLTGSDLTDPLLGSDTVPDDFGVWTQKIDPRMKFRVLEHRDFLVPRDIVGNKALPYDYKKNGPCFQVEWEIRPQWVLEVMINNPDYIYSKRVIYVDAVPVDKWGTFSLYWGEMYDRKGRLWKANGPMSAVYYKGFRNATNWLFINCQTDHYTAMTGPSSWEDFDKTYPLNSELFTVKGILKLAQ